MQIRYPWKILGASLFLIGLGLFAANFVFFVIPVQKSFQVTHQISEEKIIGSINGFILERNTYANLTAVHMVTGEGLKVHWYCGMDTCAVYISTLDQFNAYIANGTKGTGGFDGEYVAHLDGGRGNDGSTLVWNVTKTRDYIVVLYTTGGSAPIYDCEESRITYSYYETTETQRIMNDNTLLYVNLIFLVGSELALYQHLRSKNKDRSYLTE